MKTLLAKKTVLAYIAVYMVLFLTTIMNDTCGVGNPLTCPPCQQWGFGNGGGTTWGWGCFINPCYPLDCCNGTCYSMFAECKSCDDGIHLSPTCGDDVNLFCCGNEELLPQRPNLLRNSGCLLRPLPVPDLRWQW